MNNNVLRYMEYKKYISILFTYNISNGSGTEYRIRFDGILYAMDSYSEVIHYIRDIRYDKHKHEHNKTIFLDIYFKFKAYIE